MSPEKVLESTASCSTEVDRKRVLQIICKINAIMFPLGNSCTSMPKKRAVLMAKKYFENLHGKTDFILKLIPGAFTAEEKWFE